MDCSQPIGIRLNRMGVGTSRWFVNDDWGSLVEILNKIFGKEDIQDPIQRDPQLLFCSGKFEQIDREPEPPGHKARKVDTENTSDSGTPANRCQQTKSIESERVKSLPRVFAMMFCASTLPSREACCAVGGWYPPCSSGIMAQSPSAQIPGYPSTPIAGLTLSRCRSFGRGSSSSKGCGAAPAVQTKVKLLIRVPSVSSTSVYVTALILAFDRISTPRLASLREAQPP